jgi:hypothetical protein
MAQRAGLNMAWPKDEEGRGTAKFPIRLTPYF